VISVHLTVRIKTTQGRRVVFQIEAADLNDVRLGALVGPELYADGDQLDRIELVHCEAQPAIDLAPGIR
jgi:hypothetical protein